MKCEYCRRISNAQECPSCGAPMPQVVTQALHIVSSNQSLIGWVGIGGMSPSDSKMQLTAGKINCGLLTAGHL